MTWEKDPISGYRATTPFARLYVWRASARKERYGAGVEGLGGKRLASTLDQPTLEAAQAWAVAQYHLLLRAELEA